MTAIGSDDVLCQKLTEDSCMVGGLVNTLPPSVVVGTCSSDLEKVDSEVVIANSELELSHGSGTTKGEYIRLAGLLPQVAVVRPLMSYYVYSAF